MSETNLLGVTNVKFSFGGIIFKSEILLTFAIDFFTFNFSANIPNIIFSSSIPVNATQAS